MLTSFAAFVRLLIVWMENIESLDVIILLRYAVTVNVMSLGGYDVSPSYWGWIGFIIQVVFAASGWKINHLPQHEESIPTRTKHD